ncbi:MAG: hypothetical protein Q9227_008138 [Pyrenula ochraceoflavens]
MATQHNRHSSRSSHQTVSTISLLREENPNVFSDDYALDPIPSSNPSSPVSQLSAEEHFEPNQPPSPSSESSTPRPSLTINQPSSNDQNVSNIRRSVSKTTPQRQTLHFSSPGRSRSLASRLSYANSSTRRTSSTSSRFSIPRAQSPYVGAAGPSQPYGMYPQATRASSIASASTVRPPERAFVSAGGPEHPYAMYSQNTVEEDVPGLPEIPLGFNGARQQFQRTRGPEGDDFEDIVGPDGHTEQLPPYSRYADNVAPKVAAEYADTPPQGQPSRNSAAPRLSTRASSRHSQMAILEPESPTDQNGSSDSSGSFKEKVKSTSRRRICCGVQLWVIAAILGVLLLGGLLGGIIGAVVGNRKAKQEEAAAMSPDSTGVPASATVTQTQTSWVDASILPTGTSLPAVPLGQFNIPTQDVKLAANSCITDRNLNHTWDCLPPNGVGITLNRPSGSGHPPPRPTAVVDQYTLPLNFTYGPQLPDLGGKQFPLIPAMDKSAGSLGPALFFLAEYDKLIILHEHELLMPSTKRSAEPVPLTSRGDGHHGPDKASVGDKPWFCYWNQTVLEFFIFVTQNTTEQATVGFSPDSPMTSSAAGSQPSVDADPQQTTESIEGAASSTTLSLSSSDPSATPTPTDSDGAFSFPSASSESFPEGSPPSFLSPSSTPAKRDPNPNGGSHHSWQSNSYPDYPRFVKVEEKRKPANAPGGPGGGPSPQPYCQQMQVLNDGQVMPIAGNVIKIQESEPSKVEEQWGGGGGWKGRFRLKGRDRELNERNVMGLAETNCCCEWLSS